MFNKVLKAIDRVYFAVSDHLAGLAQGRGRIFDEGYTLGYGAGYEDAQADMLKATLEALDSKNPKLNNAEFQLGFAQAVAIVKGDI